MSPLASSSVASATRGRSAPESGRPPSADNDAHIVQFYEDEGFLAAAVADFIQAGIRNAEPVLVLATDAHRVLFAEHLALRGVDVEGLRASGHLEILDADQILPQLMVDGMPDREAFRRLVDGSLHAAKGRSRSGRARVFGEMVDLLWRAGNAPGALGLEELWNEIGNERTCSRLCAYQMSNFRGGQLDTGSFEAICHSHSKVLPTESYLSLRDFDSRLREISVLQQRAQALANEIEHRKAAEAALREALKVRDDFLCLAGHELLTPLTVLRLQLASLLSNGRPAEDARTKQKLAILAAQTDRLTSLAGRLLDVSQLGDAVILRISELDMTSLLRDSVDAFADIAAAAGSTVLLVGDGPVVGRWDHDRIQQVMQDLLSNAVKFGTGKPVEVRVTRRSEWLEITVRDGGPGIALADQSRIFDRFERRAPTESVAGLGLGLWIAKRVVEAHGGTIGVESQVGRGATFTIKLPYETEPTTSNI